jgi:malonyl-CoA/methylmalonyl-CoA synthetase
LNRPDATAEAFDEAGWFMTGDIACYDSLEDAGVNGGGYRILGRASVDIIKSAGYKLSALEIERAILEHEAVRFTISKFRWQAHALLIDCARAPIGSSQVAEVSVVGAADEMWGQAVCALIRLRPDTVGERRSDGPTVAPEPDRANNLEWLQTWLRERVAPYKVPSRMLEVEMIPKNVMGKVNKKAIAADFFG